MYNRDRDRDRDEYERWQRYGRDRGWFEKAGDEVRSWFGDEEAERRRRMDQMQQERGSQWHEYGSGREDFGEHYGREQQYGRRETPSYGQHMFGGRSEHRGGFGRSGEEASHGWLQPHFNPYEEGRSSVYGGRGQYGGYSGMEHGRFSGMEPGRYGGQHGMHQQHSYGGYSGETFVGRGPRNYQRSEERIKDDICHRLTLHPEVDASEIDVQVQAGEVTLSGTVESRWEKRRAEEIAEDVYGVANVHNNLRVKQNFFGSDRDRNREREGRGEDKILNRPR